MSEAAEVLDVLVSTKEAAHDAARRAYRFAQQAIANGKAAHIVAHEHEGNRTLAQNRYYWGVVLNEISEQAQIEGQRWTVDAWHELFKRTHLGYEIKVVQVAGRKRRVTIRRLRSTAGLKVKTMGAYIEKVTAFAVTDLGVRFSVDRWQDYQK